MSIFQRKFLSSFSKATKNNSLCSSFSFRSFSSTVGFIGLGKIGLAMSKNLATNGVNLSCYDLDTNAVAKAKSLYSANFTNSIRDTVSQSEIIFSVLPNDEILKKVSSEIVQSLSPGQIHVSCSTVSPQTSRELSVDHEAKSCSFVAAPVFARPDGMNKAQASIPVSGPELACKKIIPYLEMTSTGVFQFGTDPGAANVVKLCGNYLIATAIQSMAESLQLAEANGVDRKQVMDMLSSTIFNCLIYNGYGQRVAERDHHPYPDAHFALELGKKDVRLCLETAFKSGVPLPFGSALYNRFVSSSSKGRSELDWSAIAMLQTEDSIPEGTPVQLKTLEEKLN